MVLQFVVDGHTTCFGLYGHLQVCKIFSCLFSKESASLIACLVNSSSVVTFRIVLVLIYAVICRKETVNGSVPIPFPRNGLKCECIWRNIMCLMASWKGELNSCCACLKAVHPSKECFPIRITSGLKISPDFMRLEGFGKFKKFHDVVGNRTRNLPSCSIMHEPTALPHAPSPCS
jgi:hypothetical protein